MTLGMVVTACAPRLDREFVFTWPVTLFAAYEVALWGLLWAKRHREHPRAHWLPLVCALFLLLACLAYYDLCRRCDLAMMWLFLVGLVPSCPLALPAAWQLVTAVRPLREIVWFSLAFSAYYGISAAYACWLGLH
jgi:hypothetical protein